MTIVKHAFAIAKVRERDRKKKRCYASIEYVKVAIK